MNEVNDLLGTGVIFQLELKDKSYLLRARTAHQAEQWIKVLKKIKSQTAENAAPASAEPRSPSSTKLNTERKSDKPAAAGSSADKKSGGCCVVS